MQFVKDVTHGSYVQCTPHKVKWSNVGRLLTKLSRMKLFTTMNIKNIPMYNLETKRGLVYRIFCPCYT